MSLTLAGPISGKCALKKQNRRAERHVRPGVPLARFGAASISDSSVRSLVRRQRPRRSPLRVSRGTAAQGLVPTPQRRGCTPFRGVELGDGAFLDGDGRGVAGDHGGAAPTAGELGARCRQRVGDQGRRSPLESDNRQLRQLRAGILYAIRDGSTGAAAASLQRNHRGAEFHQVRRLDRGRPRHRRCVGLSGCRLSRCRVRRGQRLAQLKQMRAPDRQSHRSSRLRPSKGTAPTPSPFAGRQFAYAAP